MAKKRKTFKLYMDPGHGWLAVKRQLLEDIGIAGDISRCSYQRGKTVYLEEDRDASRFLSAMIEAGIEYGLVEKYSDKTSPIRSYEHYQVDTRPWNGEGL